MVAFLYCLHDNPIFYDAAKNKPSYRDMVTACKKTLTGTLPKTLRKRRKEIQHILQQARDRADFLSVFIVAKRKNDGLNPRKR